MRIPSSTVDRFHRWSHPAKTVRSAARGHRRHGFSRPMMLERLEGRLPLSATPVAGPIPTATPGQSLAGNSAILGIAGGDETNQSLAQTTFVAGGPAAGIGPSGAGGSAGIGGGIVESGFTGPELSPFNLAPGAFGGIHEGVIGEGPESTGNPSNDTRGAGPGAITNPAGSQMQAPAFNPYAAAATANLGAGGRFGPDTGYPAPLPDDALLPRLFPRAAGIVRPAIGDYLGRSDVGDETRSLVARSEADDSETVARATSLSREAIPNAADQELLIAETAGERDDLASDPADGLTGALAIDAALTNIGDKTRQAELTARAQRADRVMSALAWRGADDQQAEIVEAGTSLQASMMSAALLTVMLDGHQLGDHAWSLRRTTDDRRKSGERFR